MLLQRILTALVLAPLAILIILLPSTRRLRADCRAGVSGRLVGMDPAERT